MIRKKIVGSLEDLSERVVFVALAFAQHKVPYKPVKLEYNSGHVIARQYIKYCKSLDGAILEKYKESLAERFKGKFPSEAIPREDPNAKERELTIDDLKAYDAFKMYIAKINNQKFEITAEGKLIFEEFADSEKIESQTELKSLDDYYSELKDEL